VLDEAQTVVVTDRADCGAGGGHVGRAGGRLGSGG
jgi:hypothetical protein